MDIGKKIKEARMNKKITQDLLASAINVSTQAVSKWETGVSYPDITLIPAIANYLNISADELLGVNLLERKNKIQEILDLDQEYTIKNCLDDSLELLQKSLKEYPNDEYLLQRLSECYWNRMIATNSKEEYFEYRQLMKEKIIENCLKTLEIAKDPNTINQANNLLIATYPRMGEEGQKKAAELVEKLPSIIYSKEINKVYTSYGDEKKEALQSNVVMLLEWLNKNMSYRLCYFLETKEQEIELLKKNIDLIKLLIGDNLYYFNLPCANFSFSIAQGYARLKDIDKTLLWLNESYEYAKKYTNLDFNGEYDSFWLKGLKWERYKREVWNGNIKRFDREEFDFIRDSIEFIEIKNKYLQVYEIDVDKIK